MSGSNQDGDRIRIAKALGRDPDLKMEDWGPFDPFTDANDDYAVLEWIRQQHFVTYFTAYLENEYTQDYKIGDYARAALKVIERV